MKIPHFSLLDIYEEVSKGFQLNSVYNFSFVKI
jgi:hypothetical protein